MISEASGGAKSWLAGVSGPRWQALFRTCSGVAWSVAAAAACYRMHFNLSTAGSLELLLVVLVALRWGFRQASATSLAAVACLNFLFTVPIFKFSVAEPQNWVALITFEATALVVSGLSSKVRSHAAQAELQRSNIATLYDLSRAILLLDRRDSNREHLAALIREMVRVDEVDLWHVYHTEARTEAPTDARTEARASAGGDGAGGDGEAADTSDSARAAHLAGRDSDDPVRRISRRVLRVGTTPIGAIVLRGWQVVPTMADAVASLAALALERARSLEKENRAEAGRQTEQLRTAVLDGLAHAFKTPLTAILTASSGLLAIGELTDMQETLVALIDERAQALNHLTTRLLKTASLEAREVRLRRSTFGVSELLEDILQGEQEALLGRIHVSLPVGGVRVHGDREMIRLALAHLIDNAAKYSSVESTIEVTARQQAGEVLLAVENSGSPIPREEQKLIFERFYRGADAARGPAGTGLGLSIVKKTAEAHRGSAWVDSEGDRTRFFFTVQSQAEAAP